IQSVAPSLGVELRPLGVRDAGEIERAITAFAHSPNGGLIMLQRGPLGVMIQYLPFSLTTSSPFMVALSPPLPNGTNERFAKRQGRSFVTPTSQSSSASRFTARHDLFVHIPKGLGTVASQGSTKSGKTLQHAPAGVESE